MCGLGLELEIVQVDVPGCPLSLFVYTCVRDGFVLDLIAAVLECRFSDSNGHCTECTYSNDQPTGVSMVS